MLIGPFLLIHGNKWFAANMLLFLKLVVDGNEVNPKEVESQSFLIFWMSWDVIRDALFASFVFFCV